MTIAILILMETPAVGAENMGVAGGLFFTAAEIGGVFGPVGIGAIADRTGGFDAALFMPVSYTHLTLPTIYSV